MRGHDTIRLLVFLMILFAASAQAQNHHGGGYPVPDVPIRHLDSKQVQGLLSGAGMGLAKAAELNGYPGPKHAIDLAEELALSAAQLDRLKDLKAKVISHAMKLGHEIIQEEQQLQRAFETRSIDRGKLIEIVGRISALQAQLRSAHLSAHLSTVEIMSAEQTAKYVLERLNRQPEHLPVHPVLNPS